MCIKSIVIRKTDWSLIINDLVKSGLKINEIAEKIKVNRINVQNWRNNSNEPLFNNGLSLLMLWENTTGKSIEDRPTL